MSIPVFRSQTLNWERAREIHDLYGDPSKLSNFGPLVRKLESQLATLLGVSAQQLVIFSSGTDSISASVATVAGQPQSLLLPDFSFLATLRSVQGPFRGSITVGDCDRDDWSLSLDSAKSDVYVPVCIFGESPEYLMEKFSGKTAIFDAAASLGSVPDLSGMQTNHAVSFSLHATKILGAGEGGFTVFGDESWAQRAREWSNFGRSSEMDFLENGANAKMSEAQAAFILAQLESFEERQNQWKQAQALAKDATERLLFETHPRSFENPNPYWVVKFKDTSQRSDAEKLLTQSDIEFRSWWPTSLAKLNSESECPNSINLRETTLGLPMFLGITEEEISLVEGALSPVSG